MKSPFYDRTLNAVLAKMRLAPPYIADFDSAVRLLTNELPRPLKEIVYIAGSAGEAIPPNRLGDVSATSSSLVQWGVRHQRSISTAVSV